MTQKKVIFISIIAAFIIIGVILSLSFFGDEPLTEQQEPTAEEPTVNSSAVPGENNKEVKTEIKPDDLTGTYTEPHDGWTYVISCAPTEEYHGTFLGYYDQSYETVAENHEKEHIEEGIWKLENGEVKLYVGGAYAKSLWACDGYLIDSKNYFVGTVPEDKEEFQSVFVCKAGTSGDTQILNFYSDGKMIMEIIRDDGEIDSAASDNEIPKYQVAVGTYEIDGERLITRMLNSQEMTFYIVDDGVAFWVYNKVK